MSVFAGRGGVVSGAGIKSDGRWWCKLIIAGTYVGKVYISKLRTRKGRVQAEAQREGCRYGTGVGGGARLGALAMAVAHGFFLCIRTNARMRFYVSLRA